MPEEKKYKLDKIAFAAQSFEEANDHVIYWTDKSPAGRMAAATQLINQVYGTTTNTKLDRTIFSMGKHEVR